MNDKAVTKIFGSQKLTGGVGAILPLLYGLTQLNWEAAWPGIQKAMIGLGATSIAALKGEAIQRGLTDLAERIAVFRPMPSPMPDEPLTPAINTPYIPLSPSEIEERARAMGRAGEAVESLSRVRIGDFNFPLAAVERLTFRLANIPPEGPDRCKKLESLAQALRVAVKYMDKTPGGYSEDPWLGNIYHSLRNTISMLDTEVRRLMRESGCGDLVPRVTDIAEATKWK